MSTADSAAEAARKPAEDLASRTPPVLAHLVTAARRHETLLLAGGLAFFGLISLVPAVAVGLGTLRLVSSPATASALVDGLKAAFPETLQLGQLLEQTENQGGRYAGLGLLVFLWPATTLASGWTRALDAVNEYEALPGVRGLAGRLRGLGIGACLLAAVLGLIAAVAAGTALIGQRGVLLALIALLALLGLFVFCLGMYRWLPSQSRPWSALWRGAAWSAVGVAVATGAFAVALAGADTLAQKYPSGLSTALVLGLWLYAANLSLLLGDEYNVWRSRGGAPTSEGGDGAARETGRGGTVRE